MNNLKEKVNVKTSLIAVIGLMLVFFFFAYVPPIPLFSGRFFYFIEPNIQLFLRTILYFVLFLMLQVGFIGIYVWIGKQGIKAYQNIHKIPQFIERKMNKFIK